MLSALISPADIKVGLESVEEEESFAELIELIVAKNPQLSRKEALSVLTQREEKGSTAVFPCIAVPHGLCKSIKKTSVAIGISKTGVEFESGVNSGSQKSSESSIVNLIFLVLFDEKNTELHLQVLRDILQLVGITDFFNKILKVKTSQEAFDLIKSLEM